jgi:hypothetical protein
MKYTMSICNEYQSGKGTDTGRLHDFWDVNGTADYIISRTFTVVTLQFPDELLQEALDVSKALCDACTARGKDVQVSCFDRRRSAG